jgi:hypothetical protein
LSDRDVKDKLTLSAPRTIAATKKPKGSDVGRQTIRREDRLLPIRKRGRPSQVRDSFRVSAKSLR